MLDVFLTPTQNSSDSEEISPQEDGSSGGNSSSSKNTLVGSADFTKKADLVKKELDKEDNSTEDKSLVEETNNGDNSELKNCFATLQIEESVVE